MTLHDQPLPTWEMGRNDLVMGPDATYLHGANAIEERGDLSPEWVAGHAASGVRFVGITDGAESIIVSDGTTSISIYLTDELSLRESLRALRGPLYLDITSMSHSVWAPLVRAAIEEGLQLWVVYLEPETYRRSPSPTPGMIFDLSERIGGIAPLPGFARIGGPDNDEALFVPLLGFEGARLSYLIENVQVSLDRTFPVIGVPGFRVDDPFRAYSGNRLPLEGALGRKVHLAKANCPFDVFHTIHRIHREFPGLLLKLAPIGTKPHALGAVLYALSRPEGVELIYDHPVRSSKRTQGEARLCLYDISAFVASSLYLAAGEYEDVA